MLLFTATPLTVTTSLTVAVHCNSTHRHCFTHCCCSLQLHSPSLLHSMLLFTATPLTVTTSLTVTVHCNSTHHHCFLAASLTVAVHRSFTHSYFAHCCCLLQLYLQLILSLTVAVHCNSTHRHCFTHCWCSLQFHSPPLLHSLLLFVAISLTATASLTVAAYCSFTVTSPTPAASFTAGFTPRLYNRVTFVCLSVSPSSRTKFLEV